MLAPLVLLAALLAPQADEPRLVPGQRLEGVESCTLELAEAGFCTLGRSNGALVVDGQRSETGWISVELDAGAHSVELPEGPGDVTALAGAVEDASAAAFLDRAIAHVNAGELASASTELLACRARPGQPMHHALACMFEGIVLQREGRELHQARELLLGSRQAVADFGNPDLILYAEDSLGKIALALAEWDVARQCYERIRDVTVDPGVRAMAISRMAQAAAGARDQDEARRLHAEAVAALVEGVDPNYVSTVSFEAGLWHASRGELVPATALLERAAAAAPTWNQQVEALGQLALVEMQRGRYGEALGLMDRVQALAAPHKPSPYDAKLLQNRAALAFSLGEFGVARDCLEELLPILEDDAERSEVRSNLGMLAHMQGEEDEATRLYDQALQSATGRSRWLALNGQAAVRFARNLPKEAAPLSQEALQLADTLDDPILRALSLLGVSEASRRLGAPDESRRQADAALAALQAHDAHEWLLSAMHAVASAALSQGDEAAVDDLLDRAWVESGREEIAALSSIETEQVRSRLTELAAFEALAVDLAARRAARDPASASQGFARVARWKSRTLLASLAGSDGAPADLAPALASVLGDRTLVEYAAGEEHFYAFVLRGKDLRLVDLGARRPTEALVQSFVGGLCDARKLADAATVARIGRQLHDALLAPLKLGRENLVIVPDGELARLPFEALVASAPDGVRRFDQMEFVIDRQDVAYAPASPVLLALARRPAAAGPGGALLIGDPTYATEASPGLLAARGVAARGWARLPQSRDELARIARLLLKQRDDEGAKGDLDRLALAEDSRDVSLSTPAFELRLGREASVDALRTLAPSARVIHVAAHASVDRWDTHRTGLVLAWDDAGQGLFSLQDITALKLDADLVVLSACSTADGRILNGEGVQSLASAFLAAGARGVVATLWQVQDAQAQDLMEGFASGWLSGGATPERALRQSKVELRGGASTRGTSKGASHPDRQFGHPHYWAAFLFSGSTTARPK